MQTITELLTIRINDQINIKVTEYACAMTQRTSLDDIVNTKSWKILLKVKFSVFQRLLLIWLSIYRYLNEFNKLIHHPLSFFMGDISCRHTDSYTFQSIRV